MSAPTDPNRATLIVGGGIAGLACAYDLTRVPGRRTALIEAADRLGGKILSEEAEGLIVEGGPDSFLTTKPEALALVRELGLGDRLLPTDREDKDVFVYTRGALRRFPEGLMLMAPSRARAFLASDLLPWGAKLRVGLEFLIARGDLSQDESIASFTRRRFGQEALEVLAGPVMAGIYAGDPERLSLESTFPQFRELERRHGSVLRAFLRRRAAAVLEQARGAAGGVKGPSGTTMFMTLKGGLSILARTLAERLPEETAHTGRQVIGLKILENGYRAEFDSGGFLDVHTVVLAVGADAAARILGTMDARLHEALSEFRFASTATVTLAYPDAGAAAGLRGFGFVVDRREDVSVSAATYSSRKFPGRYPAGSFVIRCFLGGVGREKALEGDDEELVSRVRADLARIVGLDAEPTLAKVYRWPRANPQYEVGHGGRIARLGNLLKRHPGLILAGSSYKGVGIPDCIRSGRDAAKRLLATEYPEGAVV